MDFIECFTVLCNDTCLEQLTLANSHRLDWINRLDCFSDFFFQGSIKNLSLNLRIGRFRSKSDNQIASLRAHSLLNRGLNTLLSNNQRLESNKVSVSRYNINYIVNLATVAADLTSDVIGLMVVTDEGRKSVLTDALMDTETKDDVHLREIAVKFLLCHFVDTAKDMFVRLTESFSNFLKIPWCSRRTNRVPNLVLPLVSLLTCCCTGLYTDFFCHCIISGCVSCGGYPTCKSATNLPYLKKPLRSSVDSLAIKRFPTVLFGKLMSMKFTPELWAYITSHGEQRRVPLRNKQWLLMQLRGLLAIQKWLMLNKPPRITVQYCTW